MKKRNDVALGRKYSVVNTSQAKSIAKEYLDEIELAKVITFGLPEIDDRHHLWRIPLLTKPIGRVGEVVIDAKSSLIIETETTSKEILEKRLLGRNGKRAPKSNLNRRKKEEYKLSTLRNTVALGDSEEVLNEMPAESIDLIFTSPPYFNARPEYSDFVTYADYLLKIRKILQASHSVLKDGRFFVMNISPVLIRRIDRNHSSKRIAVPFDFHKLFIEEGYEFIDDIIWVKPEGAGWATGRGRRFAADRNPLQYKAVPVTEYVLVYRKKSDKLIDWYIKNYPDKKVLKKSKVKDGYEKTNIWRITPSHSKDHPAIFPLELAKKVIQYYSFKNDVILDPFGGIGTVAKAAIELDRKFVIIDINEMYINIIKSKILSWMGNESKTVNWVNTKPPKQKNIKKKPGESHR